MGSEMCIRDRNDRRSGSEISGYIENSCGYAGIGNVLSASWNRKSDRHSLCNAGSKHDIRCFTVWQTGYRHCGKHHIFPKHYLEKIGYDNDRDRNQIANFTYLDYTTNIDISDEAPAEYVSRYREKLGEEGYRLACAQNALPENFEQLPYPEFLKQRRLLMAQIVKKAYNELDK